MQLNLEQVVSHLQKIKRDHGDENYHAALKGLFRDLILKEGGSQYIATLLEKLGDIEFDLESLKTEVQQKVPIEAKAVDTPEAAASVIEKAIQQGMPNCKTKAHFELTLQASEALRVYLNAAFGFDRETAAKAREGLNKLIDLAPELATVTQKLEDHPEATTNRDFVEPPRDYTHEEVTQKTLLEALGTLQSSEDLTSWYSNMKTTMDQVNAPRLRNELFDAIRAKKAALRSRETN
jgi:hypothetical protein